MNKNLAAYVGLAALAVLDVGLVGAAWHEQQVVPPEPVRPASAASSASTGSSPSSGSDASPTSATPDLPAAAMPATLVAAVSRTVAWRATVGSCDGGGAVLERTTDGGTTWSRTPLKARTIVRVVPGSASSAMVVGSDDSCAPLAYRTNDAGKTWGTPTSARLSWGRAPKADETILTPGGSAKNPCGDYPLVDVAGTPSPRQAVAMCTSGDLYTSTDAGASWQQLGAVKGALAFQPVADGDQIAVLLARTPEAKDCDGVEIVRKPAEGELETLGCATLPAATTVKKGQVAISAAGRSGWLQVGDAVLTSADLKRWSSVS